VRNGLKSRIPGRMLTDLNRRSDAVTHTELKHRSEMSSTVSDPRHVESLESLKPDERKKLMWGRFS
jgi:hypothetical protein